MQLIKKPNFLLCPVKNRVHTADTDALIKAVVLIKVITHMRLANCWSLTAKKKPHIIQKGNDFLSIKLLGKDM